jgi:hypothetical protein
VEYLSSYIYIENRRFKERVFINIYVDPSIDKTVLEIPPMLIQPFVENVFCSCFWSFNLLQNWHIFEIKLVGFCNIIDNGNDWTHKQSKFHVSRGIALARER